MDEFQEEITPVDRKYIMTDLTEEEAEILQWLAKMRGITFEEQVQLTLHEAIKRLQSEYKAVIALEKTTAQYPKVT